MTSGCGSARETARSGEFDDEEAGDAAVSYRKLICFRVFVVSFFTVFSRTGIEPLFRKMKFCLFGAGWTVESSSRHRFIL